MRPILDRQTLDEDTKLTYKRDLLIGLDLMREAYPRRDVLKIAELLRDSRDICVAPASRRGGQVMINGEILSMNFIFLQSIIRPTPLKESSLSYHSMVKTFCDNDIEVDRFIKQLKHIEPNLTQEQAIASWKGLQNMRE